MQFVGLDPRDRCVLYGIELLDGCALNQIVGKEVFGSNQVEASKLQSICLNHGVPDVGCRSQWRSPRSVSVSS